MIKEYMDSFLLITITGGLVPEFLYGIKSKNIIDKMEQWLWNRRRNAQIRYTQWAASTLVRLSNDCEWTGSTGTGLHHEWQAHRGGLVRRLTGPVKTLITLRMFWQSIGWMLQQPTCSCPRSHAGHVDLRGLKGMKSDAEVALFLADRWVTL